MPSKSESLTEDEELVESLSLYRSDRPMNDEPLEEKTGGVILCKDLHSLDILYYDEDGNEYEEWDSSDTKYTDKPIKLPSMVTVRLGFINREDPETPLKFETSTTIPMAKTEY